MAINRMYGAIDLTGGGAGALNTIAGASIAHGDMAIVIDQSADRVYFYKLNAYGTESSNNSPEVILPLTNPESGVNYKNWEIQQIYAVEFLFSPTPLTDLTANGLKVEMTVDANATGIGAALYMASDGNLEEADADAAATMPCVAVALETGTGTKQVLLQGFIRRDSWNWASIGQPVFIDTTAGAFTQTAPTGSGDQVQIVGIAATADIIYFRPDLTLVEVA